MERSESLAPKFLACVSQVWLLPSFQDKPPPKAAAGQGPLPKRAARNMRCQTRPNVDARLARRKSWGAVDETAGRNALQVASFRTGALVVAPFQSRRARASRGSASAKPQWKLSAALLGGDGEDDDAVLPPPVSPSGRRAARVRRRSRELRSETTAL
ncbi:hypothetical protein S40293_11110 [Stachybotrys chartarum IBT 40293]|nr:hypothetical protein S40293_11110 [Stachybotrys chartarum IBT 40293]